METMEAATENDGLIAAITLLSMGIKSVPEAVLRKKFNESAQILLQNLQKFLETDHKNAIRSILSSLSVLLRAQEYSQWSLSSTFVPFDAILSLVIHTKPKVSFFRILAFFLGIRELSDFFQVSGIKKKDIFFISP